MLGEQVGEGDIRRLVVEVEDDTILDGQMLTREQMLCSRR
jgi:hypothetical protein